MHDFKLAKNLVKQEIGDYKNTSWFSGVGVSKDEQGYYIKLLVSNIFDQETQQEINKICSKTYDGLKVKYYVVGEIVAL